MENGSPELNRGVLVYEKSGHTLTFHKGNYICSLKQKGQCSDETEKSQDYINLEKRLQRAIMPLLVPDKEGEKCFYELERWGVDIRQKMEREITLKKEVMDAIVQVCKKENKITQRDEKDLKDLYVKMVEICYPNFLLELAKSTIKALSELDESRLVSAILVFPLFKKIYITNEGKITAVEMEGLGEYLLKYLKRRIPSWAQDLNIKIIEKLKLPESVNFIETMDYFKNNHFETVFSYYPFISEYSKNEYFKKMMLLEKKMTIKEKIDFWETVKDQVWQSPLMFFGGTYFN